MKKSVIVLILASVMLYSCSEYTCPTYTKKAPKKDLKETRI